VLSRWLTISRRAGIRGERCVLGSCPRDEIGRRTELGGAQRTGEA
jgi:hypothetical protein